MINDNNKDEDNKDSNNNEYLLFDASRSFAFLSRHRVDQLPPDPPPTPTPSAWWDPPSSNDPNVNQVFILFFLIPQFSGQLHTETSSSR